MRISQQVTQRSIDRVAVPKKLRHLHLVSGKYGNIILKQKEARND